jgi:tRNA-Thr(GGU) m(6)t(6)A37 methyltransferase TsaA
MGVRQMRVKPIGTIYSPFRQTSGMPIQPAFAQGCEGIVKILPHYAEALADLEGFERIWLLYWFDRASEFQAKVKPYLDNRKHGLFATRAPARPNPIGLSCVRLVSIEANKLHVADVDVLDGTPLLDIKPYVREFDCFEVTRNGWLETADKATTKSDGRFCRNTERGNSQ